MSSLIQELDMPKELARMLYTLRRGMDVKKGMDAFDKALAGRAFSKDSDTAEMMDVDELEAGKRHVGEGVETWAEVERAAGIDVMEEGKDRGKRVRE